jgi:NAD-dependent DNA ligase
LKPGRLVAIVGSSNLTSGGLDRNYEANVRIDDAGVAREFERFFDELFEGGRAKRIDDAWLDVYREQWKRQQTARIRLDRLRARARSIRTRVAAKPTAPTRIRGHAFAFTGGIAEWPRQLKLYPTVKRYDGRVIEAEGIRNADCLVHGDILGGQKTTRKLRWARSQGIEIISQGEFFQILENEMRLRRPNKKARSTSGSR